MLLGLPYLPNTLLQIYNLTSFVLAQHEVGNREIQRCQMWHQFGNEPSFRNQGIYSYSGSMFIKPLYGFQRILVKQRDSYE